MRFRPYARLTAAGFAQVDDARLRDVFGANETVLRTLVKGCTAVTIVADASAVPSGCLAEPVGTGVVVHLLAAGRINVDAEIAKIQGRKAKTVDALAQLQRIQSGAAYAALADDIKATQDEKLRERQAEVRPTPARRSGAEAAAGRHVRRDDRSACCTAHLVCSASLHVRIVLDHLCPRLCAIGAPARDRRAFADDRVSATPA